MIVPVARTMISLAPVKQATRNPSSHPILHYNIRNNRVKNNHQVSSTAIFQVARFRNVVGCPNIYGLLGADAAFYISGMDHILGYTGVASIILSKVSSYLWLVTTTLQLLGRMLFCQWRCIQWPECLSRYLSRLSFC